MKQWTPKQVEGHQKAARKLDKAMADAFGFILQNKKSVDEYQVQQFIIEQYRINNLISDADPPIVAFGKNTQNVHYFPSKNNCSKLKDGDLIMIDIWARENEAGMPFADITWMGFNGPEVPLDQLKIYNLVVSARDTAIEFIKNFLGQNNLPILSDIDEAVRQVFERERVAENFLHTTGHVLGFDNAHGDRAGVISIRNKNRLMTNIGYTIEPGLYFENRFGVRSEINFYIDDRLDIVITSSIQKDMTLLD